MQSGYRTGKLINFKYLRDEDLKMLEVSKGEGSWLSEISLPIDKLPSALDKHEHAELDASIYKDVPELEGEKLVTMPFHHIVYKHKSLVRPFIQNNGVKMTMELFTVDGVDIVTVLFAAYDNPVDPLIIETYMNPYFEEEGEMRFMKSIELLANSNIYLFGGYNFSEGPRPVLGGVTYVELTPEFKARAKEIYEKLQKNPDKRQSVDQFLRAKIAYQNETPLNHRTIGWLGDWRKLAVVRGFV